MKEQLKKLAKQILLYSLKIKEKENLLIEVIGKDGIPLAKEIMIEAQKLNVNTFFNIIDYSLLKSLLANANEDQIKLYAKHDLSRMKDMDAYVGISSKKCENEFLSIPLEKMQMYNKYYISKVHLEERLKKKWCILRYPNSFFAKKNNMTKEIPEKIKQKIKDKIILKRFAKPIEIANVILFLADNSSSYITGTTINVDGGIEM